MRNANGGVVLVLGILSILGFGILTGLPAWIIGNQSMAVIAQGDVDPNEVTMVQVGRTIGIVVTLLTLAGFCLLGLFFAWMALMAGASVRMS